MGCGKDKGLYGHWKVPKANVVINPSTSLPRKSDSFMSKCANNNIVGAVSGSIDFYGDGQGMVSGKEYRKA